jgi:hypothetical protein
MKTKTNKSAKPTTIHLKIKDLTAKRNPVGGETANATKAADKGATAVETYIRS